ncbi:hypothetical protein, partial [Burkholderia sp. Bp8998]|uniref:hypothetical protein n=1 Tax=Burkholderia sp. Bp8998 TaxID=2184557 RepID=UPI001C8A14B4
MNERSPCDNQMAGCEAEPTPERPAGGECDRQFVAEYCPICRQFMKQSIEEPPPKRAPIAVEFRAR